MKPGLLAFCLRSLYREYGSAFLVRVILAHPVAAVRGIWRYVRPEDAAPAQWKGGSGSLVGIGFCLKPLTPACPSGRANHRCLVLDRDSGDDHDPCRHCLVRAIGRQALACGSTVYIMTSARDMLHDVLLPSLLHRRFRSAVLTLCRFSFEPMRLALSICGVEARLLPFRDGDCRDFSTWRRADKGDKPEQTLLDDASLRDLSVTLSGAAQATLTRSFQPAGNLYEPRTAAPQRFS